MSQPQNTVLECMSSHRSVRDFLEEPVSDDHIAQAVRAAQWAATSSWIQAYTLVQITDRKSRERLAVLGGNQTQIRSAGAFFVLCADSRRHRLIVQAAGEEFKGNLEALLTGVIDTSLFAQNLNLAFESQGYGTCFIGALRNDLAGVCKELELPEGVYPLYGLCVGKAASDPGQRPRLPLELVWVRDRVPPEKVLREQIAKADLASADYYTQRGQAKRTWSGGILRRFNHLERDPLAGDLTKQGAELI